MFVHLQIVSFSQVFSPDTIFFPFFVNFKNLKKSLSYQWISQSVTGGGVIFFQTASQNFATFSRKAKFTDMTQDGQRLQN